MDLLDDLLDQLGDVEEEELTPVSKIKEIDIFASESSSSTKKINEKESELKHESDEEDEELYTKRRELSEQGMQLESWLKKNSSTSGPNSTDAWKSKKKNFLTGLTAKKEETDEKPTCVGVFNFDKFQISVRNPKISSQNFGMFTAGMKCEKLSNLKGTTTFKDSWCTMGVIVEKGITKKSANGNEYLIWRVHDLKDCQSPSYKLLLFGDAIKEHWKLSLGTVIALMSPQLSEDSHATNKNVSATLRVTKSTNIVEIGTAAHFGMCKGVRQQDGQPCSNFVNTSLSEFCVYHVMNAARKMAAKRGTFNAVTSAPNLGGLSIPKKTARPLGAMQSPRVALRDTMRPATCNSFVNPTSNMKKTTKQEEKSTLEEILSQRKNTFAARQMLKIQDKSTDKEKVPRVEDLLEKQEKHSSFGDFLKSEKNKETVDLSSGSGGTRLWASQGKSDRKPIGAKDAQEHAARLRAIAILKKQKEENNGGLKRKALEPLRNDEAKKSKNEDDETKKNEKMDRIKAILARKSLHHGEAEKAEGDALQKHLSSMEEREKIESFTTSCMEMKKVRVVTCNECKYTAQSAAPSCIEKSHKLVKHEADKRFFKCSGCKRRTVCFEMMPVKPCNNCNENKWIRVAMRDERKVVLETENLLVRGEERQFVNR